MSKKDPRVTAYIAAAPEFAKPILKHIRALVHQRCPDVEETLKWGFPHFMHKGILCGMAAFKEHCALNFWKGGLLFKGASVPEGREKNAMGNFGRLTQLADLPPDRELLRFIELAVALNEQGLRPLSRAKPKAREPLQVPDDVLAALKANKRAQEVFEQFSYSHKKEYLEWITEAKREETRNRRLQTALQWIAEGKGRNWKYEGRC